MDPIILNQSITRMKPILSIRDAEILENKVSNLYKNHDFTISEYCIDKFIKSEMDYQSPGLRGVGRISDNPPRFGGYYRRSINHLYRDEIIELEVLFKDLIYVGYFTHVLICEEALRPAELEDKYKLYQMWIMYILGFDSKSFSQSIKNIEKVFDKSTDRIKEKMNELGFPITVHNKEVLDNILYFYGIAGFTLRRREMGFKL